MNATTIQQPTRKMTRVELAEHKFNQTRIIAISTRLDLVVRYFRHQWVFIEPLTNKAWTEALNDEAAVAWLETIPYPRKSGTLEKEKSRQGNI